MPQARRWTGAPAPRPGTRTRPTHRPPGNREERIARRGQERGPGTTEGARAGTPRPRAHVAAAPRACARGAHETAVRAAGGAAARRRHGHGRGRGAEIKDRLQARGVPVRMRSVCSYRKQGQEASPSGHRCHALVRFQLSCSWANKKKTGISDAVVAIAAGRVGGRPRSAWRARPDDKRARATGRTAFVQLPPGGAVERARA